MKKFMDYFSPTYLYIKQHSLTGMLYFGKTTGTEKYLLEEYKGGGSRWNNHIRKHGKEFVETIWYCLFTEKDELVKFALMCSEQWDIVSSESWANLRLEDGLEGAQPGTTRGPLPEETCKKISESLKGTVFTESRRTNIAIAQKGNKYGAGNKGKHRTAEEKENLRLKNTGQKRTEEQKKSLGGPKGKRGPNGRAGIPKVKISCPHCGQEGGEPQMKQWHFNNCKRKNNGKEIYGLSA